ITLRVTGESLVSFQYAEATIGIGYPQSEMKNSTILAVEDGIQNEFFIYSSNPSPGTGGWSVEGSHVKPMPDGSTRALPQQMFTNAGNATVSFTLRNTSAFFLWGDFNYDHTTKKAILTSQKDGSSDIMTINDFSPVIDFIQILYWKSNLNRNETYDVQIINLENQKFFGFSSLDIIDGQQIITEHCDIQSGDPVLNPTDPNPPSNFTGPTVNSTSTGKRLGAGPIAGIAIGSVLVVIFITVAFFIYTRRTPKKFTPVTPLMSYSAPNAVVRYETDSGPIHVLPPQYDDSWAIFSGEPSQTTSSQQSRRPVSRWLPNMVLQFEAIMRAKYQLIEILKKVRVRTDKLTKCKKY
ncbi:hypothetical protein K435DRAFT_814296, partial [Dendrothele bispora CBS 962.96]